MFSLGRTSSLARIEYQRYSNPWKPGRGSLGGKAVQKWGRLVVLITGAVQNSASEQLIGLLRLNLSGYMRKSVSLTTLA